MLASKVDAFFFIKKVDQLQPTPSQGGVPSGLHGQVSVVKCVRFKGTMGVSVISVIYLRTSLLNKLTPSIQGNGSFGLGTDQVFVRFGSTSG